MKIAFGFTAHSGWAALIALGISGDELEVIERRRIELVTEAWAKQPYHAAEGLEVKEARKVVAMGIRSAQKHARQEVQSALRRAEKNNHRVVGCGVLVGAPMPDWSVDQMLAVHFRMHKAEGVLFREALAVAASECGMKVIRAPQKTIGEFAAQNLATSSESLNYQLAKLGKTVGSPWGKDQKEASLAAMLVLKSA